MLADLAEELVLGFQAICGQKQFMDAVAAHRPMLENKIAALPLLDPRRGRLREDLRIFSRALPHWHKLAATEFFQSGSLMADKPLDFKPRKDLAVMQTMVFSGVAAVLGQSGIFVGHSGDSIACRATAELINRFTSHNTTAEAVSAEVCRQKARQDQALSDLAQGVKNAP